jgi:hypothetical protein
MAFFLPAPLFLMKKKRAKRKQADLFNCLTELDSVFLCPFVKIGDVVILLHNAGRNTSIRSHKTNEGTEQGR